MHNTKVRISTNVQIIGHFKFMLNEEIVKRTFHRAQRDFELAG
jgi:hypothetical protein